MMLDKPWVSALRMRASHGGLPGRRVAQAGEVPDPADAAVDIDGLQTLDLPNLVELKLASGMTAPDRPRDLDDVIQLVRALGAPDEFLDAAQSVGTREVPGTVGLRAEA